MQVRVQGECCSRDGEAMREPTGKTRRKRAHLRAAGLRPVQIWVPDERLPSVRDAARRRSMLASRSANEREELDFLDAAGADLEKVLPQA